jgi:hypothetical protein
MRYATGELQAHANSPPREEGWLRHQENFGEAHLSAADGVVAHKPSFGVSDHPGRSSKEASRHFLNVASTPPHEEGNRISMSSSIHLDKSSQLFQLPQRRTGINRLRSQTDAFFPR